MSAVLSTAGGAQAVLNTTVFSNTPSSGVIAGTGATLSIDGPFYQPGAMTLTSVRGERLLFDDPPVGHEGLFFEAAESARCVADGRSESPLRTIADTIATLRVMDEIRRQVGDIFAEER